MWGRRRRGNIVLVVALGVLVGSATPAVAADVTRPSVVSLAADPPSVDVTGKSAQVTITGHFTDDTGVQSGYVYFRHPEHVGTRDTAMAYFTRVSGTAQDGIWQATITFPADSPPGQYYSISSIRDTSGNESPDEPTAHIRTQTIPSAPRNVVATAGDQQVAVAWDPPLSDGASAISGYTGCRVLVPTVWGWVVRRAARPCRG